MYFTKMSLVSLMPFPRIIQPEALGAGSGTVKISVPRREVWLGGERDEKQFEHIPGSQDPEFGMLWLSTTAPTAVLNVDLSTKPYTMFLLWVMTELERP